MNCLQSNKINHCIRIGSNVKWKLKHKSLCFFPFLLIFQSSNKQMFLAIINIWASEEKSFGNTLDCLHFHHLYNAGTNSLKQFQIYQRLFFFILVTSHFSIPSFNIVQRKNSSSNALTYTETHTHILLGMDQFSWLKEKNRIKCRYRFRRKIRLFMKLNISVPLTK